MVWLPVCRRGAPTPGPTENTNPGESSEVFPFGIGRGGGDRGASLDGNRRAGVENSVAGPVGRDLRGTEIVLGLGKIRGRSRQKGSA